MGSGVVVVVVVVVVRVVAGGFLPCASPQLAIYFGIWEGLCRRRRRITRRTQRLTRRR